MFPSGKQSAWTDSGYPGSSPNPSLVEIACSESQRHKKLSFTDDQKHLSEQSAAHNHLWTTYTKLANLCKSMQSRPSPNQWEWVPEPIYQSWGGSDQVLFLSALRDVLDRKEPGSLIFFKGEWGIFSLLFYPFWQLQSRTLGFTKSHWPVPKTQRLEIHLGKDQLCSIDKNPYQSLEPGLSVLEGRPKSHPPLFFFFQMSECDCQI